MGGLFHTGLLGLPLLATWIGCAFAEPASFPEPMERLRLGSDETYADLVRLVVPGITVDTHFARLVNRWKWTEETDPVKIEHAVGALIERKEWTLLSHRVIFHGRRVCHARKPACGVCVLAKDCPSYGIGPTDPATAAALVKGPETEHLLELAGR